MFSFYLNILYQFRITYKKWQIFFIVADKISFQYFNYLKKKKNLTGNIFLRRDLFLFFQSLNGNM